MLKQEVGAPDAPVCVFREGAWGNVYEVLFGMIWKLFAERALHSFYISS
jgi:hypothetical protein